jgi:phage terminase large subunit GpA-like protein
MDAVHDVGIEWVVVMSSAQVGKTELINNVVGYHIHQDPCPILVVQPTLEMGQIWSRRVAGMVRDTPVLRGLIKDPRAKDSGNTLLHKEFPGGSLSVAGSNSPAGLAMRAIRVCALDEVDRYPSSAGTEGDPSSLAIKRTTTFWNRKIVMTSTPTIKGMSRIEAAFEATDQQRYHVPCPDCGKEQILEWKQVQWPEDAPHSAYYVCVHCGSAIDHTRKGPMLRAGRWLPTAEASLPRSRGFHINELYSPWRSWGEVVVAFLEAKQRPDTLRAWINTSLGETWEEEGERLDPNALYNRREAWTKVPNSVSVLTAGIDVQDDRIEATVWGWGAGEEAWGIEHIALRGDPSRPDLWQRLGDHLLRRWQRDDGAQLAITLAFVDSGGHNTVPVYQFVKRHPFARAIRGQGGEGHPVVKRPSRQNSERVPVVGIGVDSVKSLLYARLRAGEPGPGYIHLPISPWCDSEFCAQLTAEKAMTRFTKGFPRREWVKTRPRNEGLDCLVYAYAAMAQLQPVWTRLAERIRVQKSEMASPIPVPPPKRQLTVPGSTRRGLF